MTAPSTRIGRCRLDALGPQDVRRLLNSCREATVKVGDSERPVSARTVQMVHAVQRNAVEQAVREELVPRNVVELVRRSSRGTWTGTGTASASRSGYRRSDSTTCGTPA